MPSYKDAHSAKKTRLFPDLTKLTDRQVQLERIACRWIHSIRSICLFILSFRAGNRHPLFLKPLWPQVAPPLSIRLRIASETSSIPRIPSTDFSIPLAK